MALGACSGVDGEIINLGNPDERTILDLAEDVACLTGVALNMAFQSLPPDDPRIRCPDISRAKPLLDWATAIPLEQGLRLMMAELQGAHRIEA